jgi:tryptophan synthase alpha chain
MSDLADAFADGPAFVPYLVAGDPDLGASKAYVEALVEGGADIVELGLPFSEPIAEGPTIQEAIVRALEAGMTPERYFEFVESLDVDVPVVCMTYYNLVYQYGEGEARRASNASSAERSSADSRAAEPRDDGEAASKRGPRPFVERAAAAGVDGFVIPDLPAEEADPLRGACDEFGLDLVFIVAPTTGGERLAAIHERVSGYVYVQARLGTTGARDDVSDRTGASLERVADWPVPKAVGFGIKTGEHAERVVAAGADGVIVGSALVDVVAEGVDDGTPTDQVADRLEAMASELSNGAARGYEQRLTEPERT